ncbi:M56 family metallopeptidase [Aquiflexum gelatinilyticum]|uniref:M56 family metallopeptidase n=1 Tax=Aquiflexum gelatinilyticum TaxID=2961943 RepID=UPI002168878A|nr:M56 family metallopeptidase [Aquiflexum gelatinilyticum]MCS4434019.1 M48 family metalloprotease [Aquiflexum gelatinilyticum]
METLSTFIAEPYLLALGWMIVHALWQIASVGLILWLSLRFFGKKSAAFKYRLSISALILITVLALATFIYAIPESGTIPSHALANPEDAAQWQQTSSDHLIDAPSDWMIVSKRIENWLPTLVQVWFLGAMLFLVRLATSLADIRNLRQKRHETVESHWEEVLERQLQSLKISKPVQLLKSIHVDMPMTYGVWKPVILIPAALFFQLSPLQLEAIIAHELSHIKRHDYLVNLIQSVLEVLFFFHPIFWWINKTAKEQRENACDDLAISMGISPKDLAFGLANVLNYAKNPTPEIAMAAAKSDNPTLNRIKRIMGVKTSSSQPTTITSMTMMITLLLGATLMVGASDKPTTESFEDLMATEININTIEGNWTGQFAYPQKDTVPPKGPVIMEMDWEKMTPEQKEKFQKEMEKLKDLGVVFKDMKPVFEGLGDLGSYFKAFSIAPFDFESAPIPPIEFSMAPFPPLDFDMAGIPEFDMGDIPVMEIPLAPIFDFPDSALFMAAPMAMYFPGDSTKSFKFKYNYQYNFDTTNMSKAEIQKKKAEMEVKWAEADKKRAEALEKWQEQNKDRIAQWQQKAEAWEKEFEPKAKEFEAKMKEWEEANRPKIEEFEKKMAEWEKANAPKMEEYEQKMKAWEKENQPKMDEFQKKMEIWEKENKVKLEEFQKKMEQWQKEHQEKMQEIQKSIQESTKKEDN